MITREAKELQTIEKIGEDTVVETDNIFTALNQTESIGTRVKKAAVLCTSHIETRKKLVTKTLQ